MKTLKDTAIYTVTIFTTIVLMKLILDPSDLTSIFERGLWLGIGVFLTALALLFLIVFLVLIINRSIHRLKRPEN
ncbi:hypothetical protein FITA111629_09790 [Filibacter tadaridae]|uniref:Uncharacterized protein n=1 Tax=Filibacter tadaridae TaxID=2483811 RepID=A0A3P5XK19_9BACL|nr:hypothetical protein FILTAD_02559 [Filibacter tadaridae]